MKICNIIGGYNPYLPNKMEGFIIGIDKGCKYLIDNHYLIDLAVGDFDSYDELDLVKKNSKEMIVLNPIKDDTDFEHVLKYLNGKGFDVINVYGVLGGRQDHNFLNLKLLYLSNLNMFMYDNKHKVFILNKGKHFITKDGYKYLSLIAFEKCRLSLTGTKYPIDNKIIDFNDNYTTSNEILDDKCEIDIDEGKLLIIQCND